MWEACWRCGAPWRCRKCGSFEQRPSGKGCAECHRRREAARAHAKRDGDFLVTPAIRAYLAAFDRYLLAGKEGDTAAARAAEADRHQTLTALTTKTTNPLGALMPATSCDSSKPYAFTINGECDLFIDWTWDGTSTPPTTQNPASQCNGTVDGIRWVNRSATRTYYAHLPATRNGAFTQPIPPGANGSETRRGVLNAAGLQTLDDIRAVGIDTTP